jgi:acetolactate synthase-1/2/3 large subunit
VTDSHPPVTKYADLVMDWLVELGYTHCFFVAGGNIMHLLDGARTRMVCVPVVHEVAAGIAAEYFNESRGEGRAFALVTAGPGLTNIVTAMAGAWLESRELLVLGGQVKSTDLATDGLRQRGIQEIDGVAIARPITVESMRIEYPVGRKEFVAAAVRGRQGRPGPVFIELCLDAQGAPVDPTDAGMVRADQPELGAGAAAVRAAREASGAVIEQLQAAQRPVLLIGGGVDRATAAELLDPLATCGIPLMTTWNGADRVPVDHPLYVGRPNTWGQRSANVLLAQADLIVALGTRLGLQQTGFNWQEFGRSGRVVHVDLDRAELAKGHPRVDVAIEADANELLRQIAAGQYEGYGDWLAFCREVRSLLPLREPWNTTREGYVCPYEFFLDLAALSTSDDLLVPCSSGGANSVAMQTLEPKAGQVIVTDKGLASMGYGLSGAIGVSLGHRPRRTILVEGDGGFIQNLQELATVAVNALDLKIFIFSNEGYASIRMTQKNYFGGAYLGCDTKTGLGFPTWPALFDAFGIPLVELGPGWPDDPDFQQRFDAPGPAGFVVPIDPEQTYWPKITSRMTASGSMESQPLYLMSPDLPDDLAARVFRHLS